MDVVVLAGGLGTRLRSVVADKPKPLAPIAGRPFLDYLFKQLSTIEDVQKVVLAVGYKASNIEEYYRTHSFPFEIVFASEKEPLGTGGALKNALPLVQGEHVLVLNGDSYLEFSWKDLLTFFEKENADAVIVATCVPDANRFGRLLVEKKGRIEAFLEKTEEKTPGLINGGIYLLKKEILNDLPAEKAFSLEKDVFPYWKEKRFYALPSTGLFIDIGTPESFEHAQTLLKNI